MRTSLQLFKTLTVRRSAPLVSSLSIQTNTFRRYASRAGVQRSITLQNYKPRRSKPILNFLRSYASESEKPAEDQQSEETLGQSASETAGRATEAVKETSHQADDATSGIASQAAESLKSATESVKGAASTATESVAESARDAASAIAPEPRAPTNQSSPIRTASDQNATSQSNNLYVGNLYFEVSEKGLKDEFSRYGEVLKTKIIYDGRGMSKGFGYIEFKTQQQAAAAKDALDQQVFEGRRMAVQYAIAKPPKHVAGEEGFRHQPSRTLYIGNMSYEMTDQDLNELFRDVKNVLDVRVAIDRRTGQPRGYAHADFLNVDSATAAAEHLMNKSYYGRKLRVDYTHSKATTTPSASS